MRLPKILLGLGCATVIGFGISWVVSMPNGQERGAWRLETGGAVLHLTALKATLYSETTHSCYAEISFPAHMKLIELTQGATVAVVDQQLALYVDGSLEKLRFDPIEALPENCQTADPSQASPRDVFDAAWAAMDEHYAFFDLHGVDWAARKTLAPAPDAEMTDQEIIQMLLDMTKRLDDGHVHFGSDSAGYHSPSEPPRWMSENSALTRSILWQTAINNAGTALTNAEGAPILYGLRDDGIGYVMIQQMDVDVPFGGRSAPTMAGIFGDILAALNDAKALVIDIRYNPGGADTVSFGVAGHFIPDAVPVFTKSTRDGDRQSAAFTAVLDPQGETPFVKPVVLVTSRLTGSAAEILTLAMRDMAQVTTLGEPTSGGLSDVKGFTLPNGWGLGLSNQTYLTNDGKLFEGIGIPPDITVAFDESSFLDGKDTVLDAAFETARSLSR